MWQIKQDFKNSSLKTVNNHIFNGNIYTIRYLIYYNNKNNKIIIKL